MRKGKITKCSHKDREHYAKGYCKPCYYQSPGQKEKSLNRVREWRKKNPEKSNLMNMRSKLRHLLCDDCKQRIQKEMDKL